MKANSQNWRKKELAKWREKTKKSQHSTGDENEWEKERKQWNQRIRLKIRDGSLCNIGALRTKTVCDYALLLLLLRILLLSFIVAVGCMIATVSSQTLHAT